MAAIVCHGLQSHLETQIVESRTLRLRLPSPKPVPSQSSIDLAFKSCFWDSNIKINHEENNTNINNKADTFQQNKPKPSSNCAWNFLDALSNVSQQSQKETTYVHPQQKRSSLVLSPKSLELCTENLGNESGTDIVENSIDMFTSISSSNSGGGNLGTRDQSQNQRQRCQLLAAKKAKTQNFPPPLTTIRGSESLRVRPHREDGRLVIEVTKVPPTASCFQAERSHGRLRLCFLTNHAASFDPEEEDEEEEEVVDNSEETPNEEFNEKFYENKMDDQIQDEEEEEEYKENDKNETEEEAEEEEGDACRCEEVKGCDKRIENQQERLRSCNEGGENELLNWGEPLWVATS